MSAIAQVIPPRRLFALGCGAAALLFIQFGAWRFTIPPDLSRPVADRPSRGDGGSVGSSPAEPLSLVKIVENRV